MSAVRIPLLAFLILAACDGNPFPGTPGGGTSGGSGTSVNSLTSNDNLTGTPKPSAAAGIQRGEAKNKGPGGADVNGNGFAQGMAYDPAKDTFTVDNLAFDGANVYQRARKPNGNKMSLGPAMVFAGDGTARDNQTGELIDQFSYRALYGASKTGRSSFAIVRTGAYIPYGFGGFVFSRNGSVTLPTTGQAKYTGTYAGLRDFNGVPGNQPKLEMTTGNMTMAIDFQDFNAAESATGNGAGVRGFVTNRKIFDLNGNDITQTVIDGINSDRSLTTNPMTALPTLVFRVGPGVLDNNGEMQGGVTSSAPTSNGGVSLFEDGKYYAVISGSKADEVTGVIVVTSSAGDATARETGGFILYRP